MITCLHLKLVIHVCCLNRGENLICALLELDFNSLDMPELYRCSLSAKSFI